MQKDIYLTFKTDYETHFHLKTIAHMLGKTQPEFINEICSNFVKSIIEDMEKDLSKQEKMGGK